jgi:hypothetical protein
MPVEMRHEAIADLQRFAIWVKEFWRALHAT